MITLNDFRVESAVDYTRVALNMQVFLLNKRDLNPFYLLSLTSVTESTLA